jgi:hypothetical protein
MSQEKVVEVVSGVDARKNFFANAPKIQRRLFEYNGVALEFVQPTVGSLVNKSDDDTEKAFFIRAMINHTVVPGTNEKVFDMTDYDSLLELPADGDFQNFTKIVTELMNLNVDEKVKN